MGDLNSRLKEWKKLTDIHPEAEDPEVEAGRKAERFLQRIVKSNLKVKKYRDALCFLGKRVPSRAHGRRFEVDLMVLTKKHLHFIEVKNWSGKLINQDQCWVQERRSGERIEHPDLTQYNSDKQGAVIEYLAANGVHLDHYFFSQKVVFMNQNLSIDPAILDNPCVVPPDRLDAYLDSQKGTRFAEKFLHSVIEFCLDFEKSKILIDGLFKAMPGKYFKKTRNLLNDLRTWDRVGLFGERILTGDVLKIYTNGKTIDATRLAEGTRIDVKWKRNKILGLLLVFLTNFQLGSMRYNGKFTPVSTSDRIKFHEAGSEVPTEIPLASIDWITIG